MAQPQKVVVVGNGMVGYKFCEKLLNKAGGGSFSITVIGEEPRPAYDRVHLSSYFSGTSVDELTMAPASWHAENGGACIKYNDRQIAVFHFKQLDKWYATDNECPHKHQMILSRGMLGDQQGHPKVACPFHKKTFSLETGLNLQGEDYCINVYPVKVEDGFVYIGI